MKNEVVQEFSSNLLYHFRVSYGFVTIIPQIQSTVNCAGLLCVSPKFNLKEGISSGRVSSTKTL